MMALVSKDLYSARSGIGVILLFVVVFGVLFRDTWTGPMIVTLLFANIGNSTLTWDEPQRVHYVALQEYIRKGQRVKGFKVETTANGSDWVERANGVECTTVGYKRIIPLNGSTKEYGDGYAIKGLRITILDSKACPLLHTVSVY